MTGSRTPLPAGARSSHATLSESAVRPRFCLIRSGWGPPSPSTLGGETPGPPPLGAGILCTLVPGCSPQHPLP